MNSGMLSIHGKNLLTLDPLCCSLYNNTNLNLILLSFGIYYRMVPNVLRKDWWPRFVQLGLIPSTHVEISYQVQLLYYKALDSHVHCQNVLSVWEKLYALFGENCSIWVMDTCVTARGIPCKNETIYLPSFQCCLSKGFMLLVKSGSCFGLAWF